MTMVLSLPTAKNIVVRSLVTMVVNINFVEIRVARSFVRSLETSFSMMNRGVFVGLSSVSMRFLFHVGAFLINTLRTGLLNCLNARSQGLTFRHRASCI